MRTVTETYNLYEYGELPDGAKEKAKQWFLGRPGRIENFMGAFMEDIRTMLPKSILKAQYNFSCTQGSGVNLYGELSLTDMLDAVDALASAGLELEFANVRTSGSVIF